MRHSDKAHLLKRVSIGQIEKLFWWFVPRSGIKKPPRRAAQTADKMQSSGLPGGAALARAYRELPNCLILLFFVGRVRRKPPPGRKAIPITKTGLSSAIAAPKGGQVYFTQRAHCDVWICWKKSLPLSSTRINAGKSSTSIFQIASIPSSGYATHSRLRMLC
ncbi:Uncharacterised protein [Klebsiella quasipneumoniae]|nr:hypothetical protein WP3S18C02_28150 [Klebsiella quasipneumoniae]SSV93116.1 Uncharacterised protein [Klebsiella quasipneumoniae]